jgi:hypothetical protein
LALCGKKPCFLATSGAGEASGSGFYLVSKARTQPC